MRLRCFGLSVGVQGALGCILAVAVAGCGGGDRAPSSPEAAFAELRFALATGRPELLDAVLGPRSRAWYAERVAAAGPGAPSPLAVQWVATANDIASIERSDASDDAVVLVVSFHSGAVARVPLRRIDDRWVYELPMAGEGNSDG